MFASLLSVRGVPTVSPVSPVSVVSVVSVVSGVSPVSVVSLSQNDTVGNHRLKFVITLYLANSNLILLVPFVAALPLGKQVLCISFPVFDVFRRSPVGDGDAQFIPRGFDAEIAYLLLCQRCHLFGHGIIAVFALCTQGRKDNGVIGCGGRIGDHIFNVQILDV